MLPGNQLQVLLSVWVLIIKTIMVVISLRLTEKAMCLLTSGTLIIHRNLNNGFIISTQVQTQVSQLFHLILFHTAAYGVGMGTNGGRDVIATCSISPENFEEGDVEVSCLKWAQLWFL